MRKLVFDHEKTCFRCFNTATRAVNAWNVGVKIGLLFEKVQMLPLMSLGVVDFAGFFTYGAREFTAVRKVNMNVNLIFFKVEFHIFHLIGDVQAQSGCEKLVFVVHFTFISILFGCSDGNSQEL